MVTHALLLALLAAAAFALGFSNCDGTADGFVATMALAAPACPTLAGSATEVSIALHVECRDGTTPVDLNRNLVPGDFLTVATNQPSALASTAGFAGFASTSSPAFDTVGGGGTTVTFASFDAPDAVPDASAPDSPNDFVFHFDVENGYPGQIIQFVFDLPDGDHIQLDVLLGGLVQNSGIDTQCYNNGNQDIDFTISCNNQPVVLSSSAITAFIATQAAITPLPWIVPFTPADLVSTSVQPSFAADATPGEYTLGYTVEVGLWPQDATAITDNIQVAWLTEAGTSDSNANGVFVQSTSTTILAAATTSADISVESREFAHVVNGATDVDVAFGDQCPKEDIVWTVTAACTDATGTYPVTESETDFFANLWEYGVTDPSTAAATAVEAAGTSAGVFTLTIPGPGSLTTGNLAVSIGTFTLTVNSGFAQSGAVFEINVGIEYSATIDATRCMTRTDPYVVDVALTCAATGVEVSIASTAEALALVSGFTLTGDSSMAFFPPVSSFSGGVVSFSATPQTAPTATPATLSVGFNVVTNNGGSPTAVSGGTEVLSVTAAQVDVPAALCPGDDIVTTLTLTCSDSSLQVYPFTTGVSTFSDLDAHFPVTFTESDLTTSTPTSAFVVDEDWVLTWADPTALADIPSRRGEMTTTFGLASELGLEAEYITVTDFDADASSLVPDSTCTPLGAPLGTTLTLVCANGEPYAGSGAALQDEVTVRTLTPPGGATAVTLTFTSVGDGVFTTTVAGTETTAQGPYTYTITTHEGDTFTEDVFAGVSASASSVAPPEKACLGSTVCVDLELVCADGVSPVAGVEAFEAANVLFEVNNLNDPSGSPTTPVTFSAGATEGAYTACYTPLPNEVLPNGPGPYELVVRETSSNGVVPLREPTVVDYFNEFTTTTLSLVTNDPNNVPQGVPGVPMDFFVCVKDCAGEAVGELTADAFGTFFVPSVSTPSGESVPTTFVGETGYEGCYELNFTPPIASVELGVYTIEVETAGGCDVGNIPVLVVGPPCEDVFTFEVDWTDFRDSCMEPVKLENGGAWAVYYGVLTISYDDIVDTTTVTSTRGVPSEVVRSNQFQRQFAIRFQRLLDVSSAELVVDNSNTGGNGGAGIEIQSALTYVEFDELTESLTFVVDTWTPFPFSLGGATDQAYVDFPSLVQSGTVVGTGPEWVTDKVAGECIVTEAGEEPTLCHQTTFIRVRPEAQSGRVGWSECDWLNLSSGRIPKITWAQPLACRETDGEPSSCGAAAYPAAEWDELEFDFTLDLAFVNFCAEISDVAVRAASVELLTAEGADFPEVGSTVTTSPLDLVGPAALYETVLVRAVVEPVDPAATELTEAGSSIDDVSVQAYYTGEGAASCVALAGTTAGAPVRLRTNGVNQLGAALSSDVTASAGSLVYDQQIIMDPATFAAEVSGCQVAYGIELSLAVEHSNDGINKRAVEAQSTVFASTDVQLVPTPAEGTTDGNNQGGSASTAVLASVGAVLAAVAVAAVIAAVVIAKKRNGHVPIIDEEASLDEQFSSSTTI